MFIQLGLLLPAVFVKLRSFAKTLLTSVIIICSVELIQLFTLLGSADIDDLILNTFGACLGYAVFCLLRFLKIKRKTT